MFVRTRIQASRAGKKPGFVESISRRTTRCASDAHDAVLYRKPPAFGRLEVEIPHAEGAGQGDVLGLANVKALSFQRIERLSPDAATGGRFIFARWASTNVHSTWSSATGSVAKKIALFSQVHLPFSRENGPPW